MKIAIRHQISLSLGQGVARSVQHLLLIPQTGATQTVDDWSVDAPGMPGASRFLDGFGNRALLLSQLRPEAELIIEVSGRVTTIDRAGVVGRPSAEPPPALYRRQTSATRPIGAVTSKFRAGRVTAAERIPLLHELMERVSQVVGGDKPTNSAQQQDGQSQSQTQGPAEAASSPPAADFAHAFIGAARALDIPARYVTGYLFTPAGDSTFHAWAEAWDDGLGWIGFDPMLNYCPKEHHVRVAVGLDAVSTQPVRSVPVVAELRLVEMHVEAAQ